MGAFGSTIEAGTTGVALDFFLAPYDGGVFDCSSRRQFVWNQNLAQSSACSGPGTSGTPEAGLNSPNFGDTANCKVLHRCHRSRLTADIVEGSGIRVLRKGFSNGGARGMRGGKETRLGGSEPYVKMTEEPISWREPNNKVSEYG